MSIIGFGIVEFLTYVTLVTRFYELAGVTFAYAASIVVTYIINSRFTVSTIFSKHEKVPAGKLHLYVISGIVAHAGYILFQYFLYVRYGVSPIIGNFLAGTFITPSNYYFRMTKVWNQPILY